LITTIDDLTKGLDNKQLIDAITLDFSRALYKVPQHRFTMKLHHYGGHGGVDEDLSQT
jgi:hypothetical protein